MRPTVLLARSAQRRSIRYAAACCSFPGHSKMKQSGRQRTGQGAFQFQQLPLGIETSAVAAERAVRGDDTVTRNNYRNRISVVRHPDGAERLRFAHGARDVCIRARFAIGNVQQCPPALHLEWSSTQVEREPELAAFACKVVLQFVRVGLDFLRGMRPADALLLRRELSTTEFQRDQAN